MGGETNERHVMKYKAIHHKIFSKCQYSIRLHVCTGKSNTRLQLHGIKIEIIIIHPMRF